MSLATLSQPERLLNSFSLAQLAMPTPRPLERGEGGTAETAEAKTKSIQAQTCLLHGEGWTWRLGLWGNEGMTLALGSRWTVPSHYYVLETFSRVFNSCPA